MHHPLITDLATYTDTQVEDRINDLQRKYFQTNNPDLQWQIASALEIYKEELQHRRLIAAQKQRDQMGIGNSDLDSLINVS